MPARPTPTPSATEGGKGEYDHTAQALKFIDENKDKPFFLYVPLQHAAHSARREAGADRKAQGRLLSDLRGHDGDDGRLRRPDSEEAQGPRPRRKNARHLHVRQRRPARSSNSPAAPRRTTRPIAAAKAISTKAASASRRSSAGPARSSRPSSIRRSVNLDFVPTLADARRRRSSRRPRRHRTSRRSCSAPATCAARKFFWHFPHYNNQGGRPAGAVRDGDWKFVTYYDTGETQLFNLKTDISETQEPRPARNGASRPPEEAPRRLARRHRRPAQHAQSRFRSRPLQKALRRFRSLAPHPPNHRRRDGKRHGRLARSHERSRRRRTSGSKGQERPRNRVVFCSPITLKSGCGLVTFDAHPAHSGTGRGKGVRDGG